MRATLAPVGERRRLVTETWLLLALSLGQSAVYSVLRIIERLTRPEPLGQQTTTMNTSVTPDRPWLDLSYQVVEVAFLVVPALMALFLLRHFRPESIGLDRRRPWFDLAWGWGITAAIGIPGLGFYLLARHLGLNTTVAAANLAEHWWTIPVLLALAFGNGFLEEVVMVGYLLTRWEQAGWRWWVALLVSAVVRGGYHLYQGFGGFAGNLIMGLAFGLFFLRTRRIWPLVIAHGLIDCFAFVGYSLLHGHVSWL